MKKLTRTLLAATAMIAFSTGAQAAGIEFTWDPAGAGLNGTAFTADNILVSDFARVVLTGPASGGGTNFFEEGYLELTGFQNNLSTFVPAGLGTDYSLFVRFTGQGIQDANSFASNSFGRFTSLNYEVFGVNGNANFAATAAGLTATGIEGAVSLASGSLIPGGDNATFVVASGGQPVSAGATVETSFNINEAFAAFFAAPPSYDFLRLFSSFTNERNVLSVGSAGGGTNNVLVINGGGGNATLAVPEPAALGLLGVGMAAIGFGRRRRKA